MAQGKKYTVEVREQVRARLAAGETPADIAKDMKIAQSTISDWTNQFNADTGDKNLEKLRNRKKAEFVNKAWELIGQCNTLLERRLNRAVESEEELNRLLNDFLSEDMTDTKRKALISQFASLKMENPRDIAVILGTIYDKQALANKEPTEIVDGGIKITKFEDL